MAYYNKDEQETLLGYTANDEFSSIYTTIPSDIRKYRELVYDLQEEIDDEGRVIAITGKGLKSQVKLTKVRKKREYTEEDRVAMADRMKEVQKKRNK